MVVEEYVGEKCDVPGHSPGLLTWSRSKNMWCCITNMESLKVYVVLHY
jgi:hypothetical protein